MPVAIGSLPMIHLPLDPVFVDWDVATWARGSCGGLWSVRTLRDTAIARWFLMWSVAGICLHALPWTRGATIASKIFIR